MGVRVALHLKGVVDYDFLQERLGEKSQLLLESNPVYKKIPVLIHNHNPVCESMIIVEYADEAWAASGRAIRTADPYDRALHRFWAACIDDEVRVAPRSAAVKAETQEARAEAMEQSLAGLELLEESLAKLSKGRGFVGGDAMAYLDIALGCYLGWMKACETVIGHRFLDEEKTPLLVGWAERFCSHEAVKDWMPETDELLELAKVLQPKRKVSTAN
ncbi:glutathione S-transferase [Musa troglodytarum]|uniref:Glutathione S-transferase n=1 Tax=Musa troglodytarum TaxID=320322 RepID=A0A9E7EYF4_9LILI|nr:glutathione S-transferase [Musa troglodytarum]